MQSTLLARLEERDRALFVKCVDHLNLRARWCFAWTLLTHRGGVTASVTAALLPLLVGHGELRDAAARALATLVISHLGVQLVKRTVTRSRPSQREAWRAMVREPDRFSFPSGHSAAAMAVAFVYALAFPAFALPLMIVAVLVGASRIFLGVHYPGDVAVGQLIAIGTALVILRFG